MSEQTLVPLFLQADRAVPIFTSITKLKKNVEIETLVSCTFLVSSGEKPSFGYSRTVVRKIK